MLGAHRCFTPRQHTEIPRYKLNTRFTIHPV